jgi:hypothetical protein
MYLDRFDVWRWVSSTLPNGMWLNVQAVQLSDLARECLCFPGPNTQSCVHVTREMETHRLG